MVQMLGTVNRGMGKVKRTLDSEDPQDYQDWESISCIGTEIPRGGNSISRDQ